MVYGDSMVLPKKGTFKRGVEAHSLRFVVFKLRVTLVTCLMDNILGKDNQLISASSSIVD